MLVLGGSQWARRPKDKKREDSKEKSNGDWQREVAIVAILLETSGWQGEVARGATGLDESVDFCCQGDRARKAKS
jgi:hypothetical protein